jgi:periplasmic protein TonB
MTTAPVPATVHSGPHRPRPEDMALFEALVVSDPPKRKQGLWVPASIVGHLLILTAVILVPILWPTGNPEIGDLRVQLIYNPPPAAAAPLQKGSALVEKKPEAKKTTPDPNARKPELTVPVEKPKEQELLPEQAEPETEQMGDPNGSDQGSELGMPGGVEGGVPGGIPGGVVGGCVGCTGDGPVLDYDQGPQIVRQTKPLYPQEAFVKKIEGVVEVEFLIDGQGDVVSARVIRSVPLLDAAAIATVKQWKFRPAMKGGRPVATIARAPVAFRIF